LRRYQRCNAEGYPIQEAAVEASAFGGPTPAFSYVRFSTVNVDSK